jgi:hypothetical protein
LFPFFKRFSTANKIFSRPRLDVRAAEQHSQDRSVRPYVPYLVGNLWNRAGGGPNQPLLRAADAVKTAHTFHKKEIPALSDSFVLRWNFITLEHSEFPREYSIKGFLSVKLLVFSVDYLSIPEKNQSRVWSASHVHAASISADANELDYIVKTCVCDCTAKSSGIQLVVVFHSLISQRLSSGADVFLATKQSAHLIPSQHPATSAPVRAMALKLGLLAHATMSVSRIPGLKSIHRDLATAVQPCPSTHGTRTQPERLAYSIYANDTISVL